MADRTRSYRWVSDLTAVFMPSTLLTISAYSNPYIYSITPPIATSSSSSSTTPLPSLTVHLGPSLSPRTTLAPQSPSAGTLTYSNLTMTSQPLSRTPADTVSPAAKLLFSSTPTDKALLAAEGSSIWALSTSSLEDHVDDLVREGRVGDAIGLVESVGEAGFSPVCPLCSVLGYKLRSDPSPTPPENITSRNCFRVRQLSTRHRDIPHIQYKPSSHPVLIPGSNNLWPTSRPPRQMDGGLSSCTGSQGFT